uniref:Ig-like domain-containing protein n=1 Tax=Poecilia latipinna TaxID=48699 RepID=A0A3B3TIU6_9TELE
LNSLISVTTGQLGEPVTFTCWLSNSDYSNTRVKWYKQSNGDTLRLITTLMKATTHPIFEQGFSSSRFAANYTTFTSTLTILKTFEEDEALYHCAVSTWNTDEWSGTYLSLKVSAPLQPGDSVTLQCSVLPHSQKGSCPSERRVSWFGVRKDTFLGSIIYTNENAPYNCDKNPDTSSDSKSCVYHFSKNVSSDDSGTYYCALAVCGEIIFGNGTKLEIEVKGKSNSNVFLIKICPFILFPQRSEDSVVYSTAAFTQRNDDRVGRVKARRKEGTIYSDVRIFDKE